MGNSQSTSRPGERLQNRLSKPPTNLPPLIIDSFERGSQTSLDDETRWTIKGPWLDSVIESPTVEISPVSEDESPELVSGGLGEMDFDLRPGKKSPSTLSVRMGDLKRRFSVPSKPRRVHQHYIDAKFEEETPAPMVDQRVSAVDTTNKNPGLGVTFADDTQFENQGTKRPSAFRRLSMRAPGIATRVSEKLAPPKRSPKNPCYDDDFHMYTDDQFTPEELLSLDADPRPITTPRPSLCRASTPNDFEYSYLGGLKLGSLRVVNGCASPAPSSVRPRAFSDSTIFTLSRDDLRGPLRYGSSPDAILEGVSRIPSRHRPAPPTVFEEKVDGNEDAIETQDEPYTKFPSYISEEPPMFVLDGDAAGLDVSYDAPEPAPRLIVSNPDVVEDELFDEAVDTSMPQTDAPLEKPVTDLSSSHPKAKRKGNAPGLSKSDSGYSSASSKYAYSLRRRRTNFYASSGGTYCTPEGPPPMPDLTISPSQTPSNEFLEFSPYTPPDLTLSLPRGGYPFGHPLYSPRLDTEIPSCNDFMRSFFPETGSLRGHTSWPLSAFDVTHPMPSVEPQNKPDPSAEDTSPSKDPQSDIDPAKAAKLTKTARPPLDRYDSASRYLTRVRSLVNLRKQYSRRRRLHPSWMEEQNEKTVNKDGSVSQAAEGKKQRTPNKLRRHATRYDNTPGQIQAVKT